MVKQTKFMELNLSQMDMVVGGRGQTGSSYYTPPASTGSGGSFSPFSMFFNNSTVTLNLNLLFVINSKIAGGLSTNTLFIFAPLIPTHLYANVTKM